MMFYSVIAYLFGFILFCYALLNIKKNSISTSIVFIVSAIIYILVATLSFILEEKYEWILILCLIIECVIDLVVFYVTKDKVK